MKGEEKGRMEKEERDFERYENNIIYFKNNILIIYIKMSEFSEIVSY